MITEKPKNGGKAPSIQFYYKDWLAENRLRGVSKVVKGVWIDLICLSCDMPTPGVFANENGPLEEDSIIRMLDGDPRENQTGFNYLKVNHIIKKMDDNSFYVQRVYKDTKLRKARREAGKQGGNPNFVKGKHNPYYNQTDKQVDNLTHKQKDKQKITPSMKKKMKKKKKKRGVIGEKNILKDNQILQPPDKGTPEEWAALRKRAKKICES
jgi:hypothetical protein